MRLIPLVIVGNGNVGRALLKQVVGARDGLLRRGTDLRIVGIVRRTAALFDKDGIGEDVLADIAEGRAAMVRRGPVDEEGGWGETTANIGELGVGRAVIADVTAEANAAVHAEWLRRGWHVVTCNKKPLTSSIFHYDTIMNAHLRSDGPAYRYEATVGAGLPVVGTLSDMLATGDAVIEIKAAVSGTLGFLLSACGEGTPFASALAEARARGYTEPDPRDDLSGVDVARKALILARLLGQRKDLADIRAESLVPEGLERGTAEEFLDRLGVMRLPIDDRFRAAKRRGRTLRYLLTVTPDDARVGIDEVAKGDPFSSLSGPENMFIIRTRRYSAEPLVIRGPGAGAEVTAAGVFADALRAAGI